MACLCSPYTEKIPEEVEVVVTGYITLPSVADSQRPKVTGGAEVIKGSGSVESVAFLKY